jgi:ribonuclease J
LGSTTPGYTESERDIEVKIEEIARKAKRQIFFTTISSNISRVQQALNVAAKLGKKVAFIGRSIDKKAEIARNLGYLSYPKDLVIPAKKAKLQPIDKIMYIISGSYGQPGSALYRTAIGEHDFLSIGPGDLVIFSSDPAPPGSKANIDFVVDKLIEINADVHYYDMQEDLHVSGHGSQKDILMLFGLLKPKYLIPIGGTVRHMRAYSLLAQSMGSSPKDVFELTPGETIIFSGGRASLGERVPTKNVLVDGLGVGDVGKVVLRDRQILAKDGIAIVLIEFDGAQRKLFAEPEIISRGFVFEEKEKGFLKRAAADLKRYLDGGRKVDSKYLRDKSLDFLEKYFYEKTGRRPMVLPVVVEV